MPNKLAAGCRNCTEAVSVFSVTLPIHRLDLPQSGYPLDLHGDSALGRRLAETTLFEIVDQGRINELGHVGATEFWPRSTHCLHSGRPLIVSAVGRGLSPACIGFPFAILTWLPIVFQCGSRIA